MTFALINGWKIPIQDGRFTQKTAAHGQLGRVWTYRPTRAERGIPSLWSGTTKFLDQYKADTLEALLGGRFHHWSFNDGTWWSDDGLGPQGGAGTVNFPGTGVVSGFDSKISSRHLEITAGDVIWNPPLIEGKWTISVWLPTSGTDPIWSNYVIRSDGAKWKNGTRNDALSTTWLTVSNGALALSAGTYDDLWAFPFVADEEFIQDFWAWSADWGLIWDAPQRGTRLDVRGGDAALFDTLVTEYPSGPFGKCVQFSGTPGQELSYPARSEFEVTQARMVSLWFNADSQPGTLISHELAATIGWRIGLVAPSGSGDFRVQVTKHRTGTDSVALSGDLSFDQWNHVLVQFPNVPTSEFAEPFLYINGLLVGSPSIGSGSATADTGAQLCLGNTKHGATLQDVDLFEGRLAGVKIFRPLDSLSGAPRPSAGEIFRIYEKEATGRLLTEDPEPRSPALILDGDAVNWRASQVMTTNTGQEYVQHGSSGGWVNNARRVSMNLAERKTSEPGKLLTVDDPLFLVLVSEYQVTDGIDLLRPVTGPTSALGSNGGSGIIGVADQQGLGPYGHNLSMATDLNGQFIRFPPSAGSVIDGQSQISVAAWIWITGSGRVLTVVFDSLFSTKLSLETVGLQIRAGARTVASDGFQSLTAGSTTLSQWHLVGATFDLVDKVIRIYVDGVLVGTSGTLTGLTEDQFDEDTADLSLFSTTAGTDTFEGKMAMLGIWPGLLTEAQFTEMWSQGQKGILI